MDTIVRYERLWMELSRDIHQLSVNEHTRRFLEGYNDISTKFNDVNESLYELNKKLVEDITKPKSHGNASNSDQLSIT